MKKENNSGIIELEAEEMLLEGSLENVIENTLIKANVTDKVLAALKEKYSGIKLRDVEDKETYLEAKEARKEVRKVGIITEKICKAGREDAVKIQKMWLSKEKEILGKIAEVQDPLDAEIKKFDDEIERKEQEEQKRKEEKWINRQAVLTKYGATYQDGSFVLKHISYEAELIKSSEEDTWNDTILPKYRKVYEEIESERVAEENKRKLEQERLQKEREAFEEQQRLFKKQQDEFNKQREEQEKRIRLEQEQKESAERQRLQLRANKRYKQLQLLGMQYNGS